MTARPRGCSVPTSSAGPVQVVLEDYRRLQGQYDKIVSIEMFEAVGFDHYDEFFGACDRLLDAGRLHVPADDRLAEQEYAIIASAWTGSRPTFFREASWLPWWKSAGRSLRSGQLMLNNTESIGAHYAKTLALWRERFFRQIADVRRLGFDERFQRMWDFYLAGAKARFASSISARRNL